MHPDAYTEKDKERVFSEILFRISQGGESLRKILRPGQGMPAPETFYKWIGASEEMANRYARACEDRADGIFDEILEIADERNGDVSINDKGQPFIDGDAIQRARVRIDARKWALAKMMPKKYGDRLIQSGDEENPIPLVIKFED